MLYNFVLNTYFKTIVLQSNLEVIGFCMVRSLLKLTQPFIHNEPFTLHAIFLNQRMCATSDQQEAVLVKICSVRNCLSFSVAYFNSCVNID